MGNDCEITENENAKIMKTLIQWKICDKGQNMLIENLRHSWENLYVIHAHTSLRVFELISFELF